MNSFEKSCYNFQENIINIFNKERLPFLLKYYIFKEVWEDIERYRMKLDQEVKMKQDKNSLNEQQEEVKEETEITEQ